MAPKTRGGISRRRTRGGKAQTTDVPSQETPGIEATQVPAQDTATPLLRNMATMSVKELQNLLQTTLTNEVTNIVDAVLANRLRREHQDKFTLEKSCYLRNLRSMTPTS